MGGLLLSIAIPTFNRLPFLMKVISSLLLQIQEGVEILVVDNCSSDGTPDYLKNMGSGVRVFRQKENVGAERNMLSCLELSQGQYTWILCDDDLPQAQAISSILSAIKAYDFPPILFLRSQWLKSGLSVAANKQMDVSWKLFQRNQFLEEIGQYFSVASGIVVKRDCVETQFVREHIGTNLVPSAITLSTVGKYNQAVVSDEPLVFCLSDNTGGYSGLSTFSLSMAKLLRASHKYGYQRKTLRNSYELNLRGVVLYVIRTFKIRPKEFVDLWIASYSYKSFYTVVIPQIYARAKSAIKNRVKKKLERFVRYFIRQYYSTINDEFAKAGSKEFQARVRIGCNSRIKLPFYLVGEKYIEIGDNFSAGPGLRMEAWDSYHKNYHYCPQIVIGDNVHVNFHVHIGAINRVEIGNDVLIGSHVLITDHQHGDLSSGIIDSIYVDAPLVSKGPVIIEENVWIGEGVCIMPGVRIGKNAVLGSNAVITKDVLPGQVVGGVPAKVLFDLNQKDAVE